MNSVLIERTASSKQGTFGFLVVQQDSLIFQCVTAEPPWRDNQRNISCIPDGRYRCTWARSSYGMRYRLLDVPGRSGILIHAGNHAGEAPLKTDTQGCILLGAKLGKLHGQQAVLDSRLALHAFEAVMAKRDFELVIETSTGD